MFIYLFLCDFGTLIKRSLKSILKLQNHYTPKLVSFYLSLLVMGCLSISKIDKLSHKEFKKNIETNKVLLFAKHEGAGGILHQFTLREEHKFVYTTSAFGSPTYYVGDWGRLNNSDTISLEYYMNHGFKEYLPLIILKSAYTDKQHIELIPSDSTKNTFKFEITYIDGQALK